MGLHAVFTRVKFERCDPVHRIPWVAVPIFVFENLPTYGKVRCGFVKDI